MCVNHEDEAKVNVVNALGASQVSLPASGVGSSQYALEAILTAPGGEFALNASKMSLQVQKPQNVHRHIVYLPLAGGSSACTELPSVFIDSVPEETKSIALIVVLETEIQAGSLLLGS